MTIAVPNTIVVNKLFNLTVEINNDRDQNLTNTVVYVVKLKEETANKLQDADYIKSVSNWKIVVPVIAANAKKSVSFVLVPQRVGKMSLEVLVMGDMIHSISKTETFEVTA
jgi:ribosomal protein S8